MTILFREDWLNYPTAIVDYETSNKSAIALAQKLKLMGVENNCFFLALYNSNLQRVDPHSPYLTPMQMVEIGIEASQNPWYVFREIFKAPSQAGNNPSPIEFNRANLSLWWSFLNHITFVLIQPRQTGKSFCTDLLMTLLINFLCRNTEIALLTKDDSLRRKNIQRLKDIYIELPPYFNFKDRTDSNNTEQITINKLGNVYSTHVPQAAEKAADKVGRGITVPIFHLDEPPYQSNIAISFPVAMGSMGAAIEQAKANDEPWGVIMTTTAGKKDDRDGKYVYNFLSEAATWSEKFLDTKNQKELYEVIRRNSRDNVVRIFASFSYKQLGKTDEWLKDQLERTHSTPEQADRDFFNIWTSGSVSSPIPVKILDLLNKSIISQDHDSYSATGGYILNWYIPEAERESYMNRQKTIIGLDTSDAGGGDAIGFTITSVETGDLIAKGVYNKTNLTNFVMFLVEFLCSYLNTTLIIERRSTGAMIIDYLLLFLPRRGIDPFERIFNWVVNDPLEHKSLYEEIKQSLSRRSEDIYVRAKTHFGFATSGYGETSRTGLYSKTLQTAVKLCATKIRDRALTEQLTGLVTRNGRIDHDVGGHDDLVISWLLAHWFLTTAKNLEFYGIDSKSIFKEIAPKVILTPKEAYFEEKQNEIRNRITELFELLSKERNGLICKRYEQELRYLDRSIVLKDQEYFSLDALLRQANEAKDNEEYASTLKYGEKSLSDKLGYKTYEGNQLSSTTDTPQRRF
jgi:hypothetical protein